MLGGAYSWHWEPRAIRNDKEPFVRRLNPLFALLLAFPALAQREGECANNPFPDTNPGPGTLKGLPVPQPGDLTRYVRDRQAAIALGKALFWDMQAGSDGIQACASCHFRAGADPRSINQLNPGGANNPDTRVQLGGLNYQLRSQDFPLHKLTDPADRSSTLIHDYNDVVSSQGIKTAQFTGAIPGFPFDLFRFLPDSVFNIGGLNTRRAEPRNTPTVINAAFNRQNFWDGRADIIFNGVNEWGVRDVNAQVLQADNSGRLTQVRLRITNGSLASQAVGPPLSTNEMGFVGRDFKSLGRKLAAATPLLLQKVHADDSVLGPLSYSRRQGGLRPGLDTKYQDLIEQAFEPRWWKANQIVVVNPNGSVSFRSGTRPQASNEYTALEYNFSLYFGLAIQLYEMTLISDDSPVDRYFDGNTRALSNQQIDGLALFRANACAGCHSGAETTNNSTRIILGANGEPAEVIERMFNGNCEVVLYDQSFYNLGVRPTNEDLGRGNMDPFGNPLAVSDILTRPRNQIPSQELFTLPYPNIANPPIAIGERVVTSGTFKVPGLRNVALTAPYFHNGGQATLRQVVEFYNRGSDFRETNGRFIAFEIGRLSLTSSQIDAIVAFLEGLTDQRVVRQQAPFDHPQIFVPNGHIPVGSGVLPGLDGSAADRLIDVPAVGRTGGPAASGFLQ